jgi:hypothetical protein
LWYNVLHINDNDVHNKLQRFQLYVEPLNTNLKHVIRKYCWNHIRQWQYQYGYGYEYLTSQQQHERLTESVETKFFRFFIGHTLFDHKTNEELWQELHINNLNQINVDYRYKWTWQLLRMNNTHIPQLV